MPPWSNSGIPHSTEHYDPLIFDPAPTKECGGSVPKAVEKNANTNGKVESKIGLKKEEVVDFVPVKNRAVPALRWNKRVTNFWWLNGTPRSTEN